MSQKISGSASSPDEIRINDLTNVFQTVFAGPIKLYSFDLENNSSAEIVWVKFSDTTSGAAGTVAVKLRRKILHDGYQNYDFPNGPIAFNTGCRVYVTTTNSDTGAQTAPATNADVTIRYKRQKRN